MAVEDINTVYLPFMGEVEIDSVAGAGMLLGGLVVGTAIYSVAQGAGNNLADWVSQKIGQYTGMNPQTGGNSGPEGV